MMYMQFLCPSCSFMRLALIPSENISLSTTLRSALAQVDVLLIFTPQTKKILRNVNELVTHCKVSGGRTSACGSVCCYILSRFAKRKKACLKITKLLLSNDSVQPNTNFKFAYTL